MKGLTDKQRNILNFIGDFMDVNLMAPTVYEIAEHFHIKTSTVFAHLRSLQRKDFISRSSKARSISLSKPRAKTRRPNGVCSIPFYEKNGQKAKKEFYYDSSVMKDVLDSRKLFAVRIQNSSMHSAGILDGDIAILRKFSNNVKNGDIVLVEVDGNSELRTFRRLDDDTIELAPSSDSVESLTCSKEDVSIRGVLIGIQRSL
ncbi:MAG: LexA repressor [Lentisphaerae bacterium ADurb.Bin242]|nr:MAG: LexA repressor [Lentisphaerae bacterium ADurb.Bin242]